MTIIYQEFDTTQANLINELVTRITAHPDWSELSLTWPSPTITAAGSTSTTTFTLTSLAGMSIGQRVRIKKDGTGAEYVRILTAVNYDTNQVTINTSLGVTTNTSTTFTPEGRIVKATTTRGADMIVDLLAGDDASEKYRLNVRFWQALPADYGTSDHQKVVDRYLYFRPSGGTATDTEHVVLSVSKEHLFISVEGPRAHESGTPSTTYGSPRSYLFISDVVPYHAGDAYPCVVASAGTVASMVSSVNNQSHLADLSISYSGGDFWDGCRLGSITFPTCQSPDTVAMERDCTADGNKYLFPYVVFSNKEGIRGRLLRFFYAGTNAPTSYADSSAPVGEKVTYDGIVYKLLAVNKGSGGSSDYIWGAFGSAYNNSANVGRSIVVAVPHSVAV